MNESKLKSRAQELVKRLNALGFSKDGKPLVIDQAYELIAAEEGYRNQHELRAVLKKQESKTPERNGGASEMQAHFDWGGLVERQGWSDSTQRSLAMSFIGENKLMVDFFGYAQAIADAENGEELDDTDGADGEAEEIPTMLQNLGYKLCYSDYKRPYWEYDDDASDDFESVGLLWVNAWKDAQARVRRYANIDDAKWDELTLEERLQLVRQHLHAFFMARIREHVDSAYENYDFGPDHVEGDDGWVSVSDGSHWERNVYLSSPDAGLDEPSRKVRFIVDVTAGNPDLWSILCKVTVA